MDDGGAGASARPLHRLKRPVADFLTLSELQHVLRTAWDLGARKAKEILYENSFMTAQEAMTWGFVNRVYPAADLEKETLAYANRVAEHDPFTTRIIKFAINQVLDGMGFTTSVRSLSTEFIRRPAPQQPSPGAPAPQEGRFRNQVARALGYLREDRLKKGPDSSA